jgi:hypothetical protein
VESSTGAFLPPEVEGRKPLDKERGRWIMRVCRSCQDGAQPVGSTPAKGHLTFRNPFRDRKGGLEPLFQAANFRMEVTR